MNFVNPALLYALFAIGVPLCLHLFLRDKPTIVTIPTVRFIEQAMQRTRASRRFRHLMLLGLRIAIIAVLVVALSQPMWRNSRFATASLEQAAVVIIIDNAYYTAQSVNGQSQLAHAKQIAHTILSDLAAGSKVACFTTTTYSDRLTLDSAFARQTVTAIQVENRHGDLPQAIAAAGQLLTTQAPDLPKRIIAITDFNTAMVPLHDGPLAAPPGCRLQFRALPERTDNAYIHDVTIHPASEVTQHRPLSIIVRVGGGDALNDARVSLYVNGERTLTKTVREPDNTGNATIRFDTVLTHSGHHRGEIRLERDDPLASDNQWYFTLTVNSPARALLIENPATTSVQYGDILAAAIAPPGWHGRQHFSLTRSDYMSVDSTVHFEHYDALILSGKLALDDEHWIALHSYTSAGGCIIVFPDHTTDLKRLNGGALPLLPGPVERVVSSDSPVFLQLAAGNQLAKQLLSCGRGDIGHVPIDDYFSCAAPQLSAQQTPILWYSNDRIAIAIRHVGHGQAVFVGCPLAQSPLVDNPAVAPMIHQLLHHLFAANRTSSEIYCGALAQLRYGTAATTMTIERPDGSMVAHSHTAPSLQSPDFDATDLPGHYLTVNDSGVRTPLFAANIYRNDQFYSFVNSLQQQQLNNALAAPNSDVSLAQPRARTDLPLMPVILGLCSLLLFTELHVANRR